MIIFGTRGITSVLQKGSFHCPACGAGAEFERKGVRRWFTLFFIPCIPLDRAADYIDCKRCGCTFKPDVLNWNGTVPGQTPPPVPQPQEEIYQLRPSVDPKTGMPLPPPVPQPQYAGSTVVSYQSNGTATAALVFGILGLITSFLVCPGFIFLLISILCGLIALGKVKKGNGLVGGKGVAKAGLICSAIGLVIMIAMIFSLRNIDRTKATSGRAEEPWKVAAANIRESSPETAWGNTAEAKKLAATFAEAASQHLSLRFSGSGGKELDNRFVVHCELTEGRCAFLVHVPDYRKYKGENRDLMNEIVWFAARDAAVTGKLPETTKICVAQKGIALFGDVLDGTVADETPAYKGTDVGVLYDYFIGTVPKSPSKEEPAVENATGGQDEEQ